MAVANDFLTPGQSNGVGRFAEEQPWIGGLPGVELIPQVFRAERPQDGWMKLREHATIREGGDANHVGSQWPRFATHHMAATGVATRLVTCAVGGTGIVGHGGAVNDTSWAVGNRDYLRLISTAQAAGLTAGDILLDQGENESQDPYRDSMEDEWFDGWVATRAGWEAALGWPVRVFVALTGNIFNTGGALPTTDQRSLNAIRRAQMRLWDQPGFMPGQPKHHLAYDGDPVHPIGTPNCRIIARNWWHFANEGARGPRLVSAELVGDREIDLTFTVANGGLTMGFRPTRRCPKVVGADLAVLEPAHARISGNVVRLVLPSAPVLPCTVRFGLNADASETTWCDAALLPPEPFEELVAA